MLLFATDLIHVDFVPSDHPDDRGFLSALASFETPAGAHEACDRLNGKVNAANDGNMVVEVLHSGVVGTIGMRRNTIDGPPLSASSSSVSTANTAMTTASTGTSTGNISRQTSYSVSSDGSASNKIALGNRSRFNGTFQSLEMSPPAPPSTAPSSLGVSAGAGAAVGTSGNEFPAPDSTNQFHNLFSPQSPLGSHQLHQNSHPYGSGNDQVPPRVTGKSVINDDIYDDETGELLKDPVAYAENGQAVDANNASSTPTITTQRRTTNPQAPVSRLANLSLTGSAEGPVSSAPTSSMPAYSPSCFGGPVQPTSLSSAAQSNTMPADGATAGSSAMQNLHQTSMPSQMHMQMPGNKPSQLRMSPATRVYSPSHSQSTQQQHSQVHTNRSCCRPPINYPPVNPADQNPPCNTLYVGNLPIDTSEDELKAMFSKQRGYRRLCFRTKQNGPMCFVEFEDVSFATKALNELYGQPLHNSVKGGIRLSFSKNPLGVRAGQQQGSSNSGSANGINGIGGMGCMSMGLGMGMGIGLGVGPMMGTNLGAGMGMGGGYSVASGAPGAVYSPQQIQQHQSQPQPQQQHMISSTGMLGAGARAPVAATTAVTSSVSSFPSHPSQQHQLMSAFSPASGNPLSLTASPAPPTILNGLGAVSSTGVAAPAAAVTTTFAGNAGPSSSSTPALSSGGFGGFSGFGRTCGYVGTGNMGDGNNKKATVAAARDDVGSSAGSGAANLQNGLNGASLEFDR